MLSDSNSVDWASFFVDTADFQLRLVVSQPCVAAIHGSTEPIFSFRLQEESVNVV